MDNISFEWNPDKARINLVKHGISFNEASSVFLDEYARIIPDPEHSDDEDRFIILGLSHRLHLLVVCHCYRANQEIIRIISARKATRNEEITYNRYL
jgi:uncharacterized DUF497 family protein